MNRYRVPRTTVRTVYRHGNSRFVATATRASGVDEAKEVLRSIRAEMPDATHHVHAMKIGYGASVVEGLSDDGEPSGTSGPPILAVLRGAEIGDIIIVVTRYFGGTKLGTGGLVTAYSTAAKQVLALVETEEKIDRTAMRLLVSYAHYESVCQLVVALEGLISREEFGETVALRVDIPVEFREEFVVRIRNLTAGQVTPEDAPEKSG